MQSNAEKYIIIWIVMLTFLGFVSKIYLVLFEAINRYSAAYVFSGFYWVMLTIILVVFTPSLFYILSVSRKENNKKVRCIAWILMVVPIAFLAATVYYLFQ